MSEKRRDSKGRILRTGESQRKNGMYEECGEIGSFVACTSYQGSFHIRKEIEYV